MANEALLQVRMPHKTKDRAMKYFQRLGLSASDGVRLLINQELKQKELEHYPNAESRKAIAEFLAGGGEKITRADLLRQWDEA